MQQTADAQINEISPVRSIATPVSRVSARLAYIDVIRMVLTIMVIMVHAAITYGSLGDWTYVDPVQDETTSILLSFFVILSQSFFMGLFFFFAGYFIPRSYDHKSLARFWKDRLLRLALPMVAYTWFLSKVPNYLSYIANQGARVSFLDFFRETFWSEPDKGPTWFLFALLVFCVGYTLWRLAARLLRRESSNGWLSRLPVPGVKALLGAALVMAVAMFAVGQLVPLAQTYTVLWIFDLQMAFFPQYILLFVAGILAYRSGWLSRLPGSTLRFWAWLSAALVLALPVLLFAGGAPDGHLDEFMSGWNWRCVVFNLWIGLSSISFSTALTLWLRERVKPQNRLAAFAGPRNFTVYLIHPLILVPISFGLSSLPIPPAVKFGVASLLTVSLCFLLAGGLRRIPGLKAVL